MTEPTREKNPKALLLMSPVRKVILISIFIVVVLAILAENPVTGLPVRTSILGRAIRWCLGEPGATQWVNDTVEEITLLQETAELQEIGDRLMSEFGSINSTLPTAPFPGGKAIPLEKLPLKYRKLGGEFGDNPDLVLQMDQKGFPMAVVISWGHMRQSITIFSKPPSPPPKGFFVRKLNSRIYVVACES
jgi:hypothetical protein